MSTAERSIKRGSRSFYSIGRALLNGDGFEAEVSQEQQRSVERAGIRVRSHGGIFIPPQAALTTSGTNAGQELVFTTPGGYSGPLRPASVAERLGARIVTTPSPIRVIRGESGIEIEWLDGETITPAPALQNIVFGSESPEPSTGLASIAWTRRLNALSEPAVAQLVDEDARAAVRAAIDSALIAGSGTSGEPAGLLAASRGLEEIDLAGAAIDYDDLLEMEALLGDANVDDSLAWLASPRMRQALRKVPVLGNVAAGPVWRRGTMLDHSAFASGHVQPAGTLILGRWFDAVVVVHAVEVLVDNITLVGQGLIGATVFVTCSIALQRPGSFLLATNALVPSAAS